MNFYFNCFKFFIQKNHVVDKKKGHDFVKQKKYI